MIAAVVLDLRALRPGSLRNSSGTAVHGVWFRSLEELDADLSTGLHTGGGRPKPFTLSPLTGLPPAREGVHYFPAGQAAQLRVCTLSAALTRRLPDWLNGLPPELEIGGTHWQVTARCATPAQHPHAGLTSYLELREQAQARRPAPQRWSLEFLSPTAFNGLHHPFPFPLPDSAAVSWLRRWKAFTSDPLWPSFPEAEFKEAARQHLSIESYTLHTTDVHLHKQSFPGCQGQITYSAHAMPLSQRQALDALFEYAQFCGSGYKTTQGWGQTRLLREE